MRNSIHPVIPQDDVQPTGFLLDDSNDRSDQSEDEDDARAQPQATKTAAWVDEDDELEEV